MTRGWRWGARRLGGTFRSLRVHNYRVWAAGALVSNLGTWVQRTAQDWLVLTQLTHHDATALGTVMALQFAPQALLLPLTGAAADRFNRRHILMLTQTGLGLMALGLGVLTVTHIVRLWQVYVFAFAFGCIAAFDAPASQTFVAELVGDADLPNAVGLNATSFNAARMVGGALAGGAIAVVGCGPAFLLNGVSYGGVIWALASLRRGELYPREARVRGKDGGLLAGFRYVRGRPDLTALMLSVLLVGAFCFNFPVYLSTMAVGVFHVGAGSYGLLMSFLAVGTVSGSLVAAGRRQTGFWVVVASALGVGVGYGLAALAPRYVLFGLALVVVGAGALSFTTASNSLTQLTTEPAMRGRVMAIRIAILMGATPIGAPIAGAIADRFGPRFALAAASVAGFAAAAVAGRHVWKMRRRAPRCDAGDAR